MEDVRTNGHKKLFKQIPSINDLINVKIENHKIVQFLNFNLIRFNFDFSHQLSLFEVSIVNRLIAAMKWPFKVKMGFIFPISVT